MAEQVWLCLLDELLLEVMDKVTLLLFGSFAKLG
jgi:hypothetical protein